MTPVAVPIRRGDVVVAASRSWSRACGGDKARPVSALTVAAHGIGHSLGPHSVPGTKPGPFG
jgi:hypothetical protein